MLTNFFRAVWAILKKDVILWLRNPSNVSATLIPPVGFLLVGALSASGVGVSPVALVTLDHSTQGIQMQQVVHASHDFRIVDATAQQAQTLLKNIQVIAVITIPADFTRRVTAHNASPLGVTINNLNLDFTNDIRRAVPDVITQYYQAQGSASPIKVTVQEHDLRQRDIELFQFSVLPTIVLLLMVSGLVTSSISTAYEWESRTMKELLLSPVSRVSLILGKVLAGFATTFLLGLIVLLLGYILGWTRPEGLQWIVALFIIALIALFAAGLGVALGTALRVVDAVIGISITAAIYLFFLAGGIGVIAFEPVWLQNIAAYIPLTYGDHALEQAIFYSSNNQFGRDVLVLGSCAIATLFLGVWSIRRSITS